LVFLSAGGCRNWHDTKQTEQSNFATGVTVFTGANGFGLKPNGKKHTKRSGCAF
jgi:hypothetical protein